MSKVQYITKFIITRITKMKSLFYKNKNKNFKNKLKASRFEIEVYMYKIYLL